jgi:hypothetical protein
MGDPYGICFIPRSSPPPIPRRDYSGRPFREGFEIAVIVRSQIGLRGSIEAGPAGFP